MPLDNPFASGPSSESWSCNVKKTYKICCLPGDGIGPEIIAEGKKVLAAVGKRYGVDFQCEDALIGGAAIDACDDPLPEETLAAARASNAVLLASVGGPKWDSTDPAAPRPEQGLLRIRKELGLYTNLRPVQIFAALADASTLRPEVIDGVDMMIVRELTGGLYFGKRERFYDEPGAGTAGAPASARTTRSSTASTRLSASRGRHSKRRASAAARCRAWTRPTCWRQAACGERSFTESAPRSTRTWSWRMYSWTTRPCSSSVARPTSTWW